MPSLKKLLIGKPISSEEQEHQRLRKVVALPIFASDAISSTAYATDEILVVLLLQAGIGAAAFNYAGPDRHRRLLPDGRSWSSATGRRSMRTRRAAAPTSSAARTSVKFRRWSPDASLLVDYILTVAVSVAGGVLAMRTAFGFDHQVHGAGLPARASSG